jgi:hypothetical protein
MKLRIIIALILTLILLSVARRLSERKPELKIAEKDGVKIEHTTVVEKVDGGDVEIYAKISTPESAEECRVDLAYRIDQGNLTSVPMVPQDGDSESLSATIPSQQKGKRAYYHIAVTDRMANKVTLPDRVNLLNPPFMIKFKGRVAPYILAAHIFCMFATIFFTFLALFASIDLLKGKEALSRLSTYTVFANLFIFLGGFPLGFLVAFQTFGVAWGGIPFGWDITDNKTVILFAYWLILLYLIRKTVTRRRAGLNAMGNGLLSTMTVLGVILTLLIYLIPHSI